MALRRNRPAAGKTNTPKLQLNYYRSRSEEPKASPFVKKTPKTHRLRKYFVRTIDLAVVIVLILCLGYSLLVKSTPSIMVNDTAYHTAAQYQAVAATALKSLKNRNKVTLNEQTIVTRLEKHFPEISSASVELPLFSETAVVHISVAEPSIFLDSGGTTYIVDSEGVATSLASSDPDITGLINLSDQSGFKVGVGQQVLSAGNISFIQTVVAQTKHAGVPIKSLVIPTQVEELDLYTSDRSYYVKFYMGGNPLLETGQFLAARHNFDQTSSQPSQYLDVRVPGKIFYK